ncbi:MAG: hypothetical protein E7277_00900 [Lachnospiraceae bacterium]|nr:hypothetical protein [Lachnospiraceae bacterium]
MDISYLKNNPALANIDATKLGFLIDFANNQTNASNRDLLPLLLAASSSARQKGITFSDAEKEQIINLIRPTLSSSEQAKLDKMLALLKKQGH